MKLLRLKIDDPAGFRSLQTGFEIHFLREWQSSDASKFNPYILAGPNGSGKSNLLEVLAAIFYHLEVSQLKYRPINLEYDPDINPQGFKGDQAVPDAFELEYLIVPPENLNPMLNTKMAHLKIIKQIGKYPVITWVNRSDFDNDSTELLTASEIKELLPEFVVGYTSGENEILSLPFFKMRFIHFDEYKDFIINKSGYGGVPEGRLIFLSSEYNQAILLANLLMQEEEALQVIRRDIGVTEIKSFRIVIKKYCQIKKSQIAWQANEENKYPKEIVIEQEDAYGGTIFSIDLIKNINLTVLKKLESCSTCRYYDENNDELFLDYWVNDQTKLAFKNHFNNQPIELFQAFQILFTLNLVTVSEKSKKDLYLSYRLDVKDTISISASANRQVRLENLLIRKAGINQPLPVKSLSDGEYQLLHTLGLCLLYKDRKALFLLDEPDTHFNPDWRAKFITSLRDSFNQQKTREMLITTHSPFLISDSQSEYVLEFKNNTENHVSVNRPDYNTLGASINKITMKTFGKKETIGGYAEQLINLLKQRLKAGESKQIILDEVNELLGDSVEKVFFVNTILDSMELK